jgi:hypothetical protein
MKNDIEVNVFEEPSGNIIALVNGAVAAESGRRATLCHANAIIYTDRSPDVTVNTSRGLSLASLTQTMDMLQRFEGKVRDLAAAYGPGGTLPEPSKAAATASAANSLVRHHLDSVEVHPCDEHNDEVRAGRCIQEVRDLHTALQR